MDLFVVASQFVHFRWVLLEVTFHCSTESHKTPPYHLRKYIDKLNYDNKREKEDIKCTFDMNYFYQLILLFSLFLLLFMSPTALFGTIYESHCTISANFYLY